MIRSKYFIPALAIFILFSLFHLFTLNVSPVPWGDEIFINSITVSFIHNGMFTPIMVSLALIKNEALYYGPLFFVADAAVIKAFGNGMFQARIIELVFGLFLLIAISNYSYSGIKNKRLWFLLFLAFAFDPFFNSGLNRGRMDITGSFFYFISAWLILDENILPKRRDLKYCLSGLMYALSILVTFRLTTLGPAFAILGIFQFIKSNNKWAVIRRWLLWGVSIILVYSIWVFTKFGSYTNYIDYVLFVIKGSPFVMGSHLTVPTEEKILFLCAIVILLITLFTRGIKFILSEDVIFFVSVIAFFFLLVGETGPYTILVIPYVYLLVSKMMIVNDEGKTKFAKIPTYIFYGLVFFNLVFFASKATLLGLEYKSRNYNNVEAFVRNNIPQNSRVVSDEIYYYAILNSNSQFRAYLETYSLEDYDEMERKCREECDYQYLFISERVNKRVPKMWDIFSARSKLVKVAELKSNHLKLLEWLARFKVYDFSSNGYDGVLYKRVK